MERLTNHFDYCKMIDCKFYDAELYKQGKCKFFDKSIEHCHEKRMNDKLKEYEDAEEQGLLLKLPCKIGNKIYVIPSEINYDLNIIIGHAELNRVYEQTVHSVQVWGSGYLVKTCNGVYSVLPNSDSSLGRQTLSNHSVKICNDHFTLMFLRHTHQKTCCIRCDPVIAV